MSHASPTKTFLIVFFLHKPLNVVDLLIPGAGPHKNAHTATRVCHRRYKGGVLGKWTTSSGALAADLHATSSGYVGR